ncbi:MAG: hypothetical protein LBH99_05440 [Rickettsia sp.]|jgi:hypothetical protein|nr:hypothetical protein [Rickettsia sp.]
MAKNKHSNIEQYLALTNNVEEQEPNDNDVNALSKLIGEIRNQMFGQKSGELYNNAQLYYDAEHALELMENNNQVVVTFQNLFGKSVKLTKDGAEQIKTGVEQSVPPREIKEELINSLWQKFELDNSHAPKIYSENALNKVLEGLGYEKADLVLQPFNNFPNAQAHAPAYNYVDRDDEDDSFPNARAQRPMHNDFNEQDEFGTTMDIYKRGVEQGGFGGDFNDAHAGNHQFNNFRYDEDDLDSLPNAQAQAPAYNDVDEYRGNALGTMELQSMLNRGGFNDAHAGNHQLDTFNAEQGNAFNSLDHTQANIDYFSTQVDSLFEQFSHYRTNLYNRFYKSHFLKYYTDGNINNIESTIKAAFQPKDQQNIKQKIISLRNSCYFNDQSFRHPEQKPVVEENQLISGMEGIQLQQPPVPEARTSLTQSKPQEAAITQPRNSDEEIKKINEWLEYNNLSKLTSFSTLLLKKYYQDPLQKSNLDKICDNDGIWGTNRQKLISLITGESIVREKFLLELDKNELKVSSSTENAIMKFLTSGKPLNWSTTGEDAVVQIFIGEELYKYQTLKDAGKAREYTMDYETWQHANEQTTNMAARAATDKVQAEKVAEKAKIQQLLEDYPNTKPVFNQLQELNLSYSQINRVIKKINEFLNNPNSDKTTFNAKLSTALISDCLDDNEFNLVSKIFAATISYKERHDHNNNAGYLNEGVDHNAGYYHDHYDYTINLLGEEEI